MAASQRMARFHRGASIQLPPELVDAVGFSDGTPLIIEQRDNGVFIREMTTQEEIDAERTAGIEPIRFYSEAEFDTWARTQPAADDPA